MRTAVILSTFLISILPAFGQTNVLAHNQETGNVFIPISKYLELGDSGKLSAWFADNLEINILGRASDCSKSQAREIISAFFESNAPQRFEIIHKSGDGPMKFAIGTLYCGRSRYSITIFVKITEKGNLIQMIQIENN